MYARGHEELYSPFRLYKLYNFIFDRSPVCNQALQTSRAQRLKVVDGRFELAASKQLKPNSIR